MKPFGRRLVVLFGILGALTIGSGVTAAGLTETRTFAEDLTTAEIASAETPLGDFVADAIRDAAGADAAFIAASYFAGDVKIPRANVTAESVVKALEYKDDSIVIVNLTGAQITKALDHGLYLYPQPNSGFLQFSGLTVTVNPAGDKAKVTSVRINGSPLEAGKTYRVAMPAPLANGALAYFRIWSKDNIEKASVDKLAKTTLQVAVTDYLRNHKTLTKGEERLVKGR